MRYVQYGCGLSAPIGWMNFDSSPTLQIQKLPLVGFIARRKVSFPGNVLFGDIVKGLPGIIQESCNAVYCSHVLEHLALEDLRIALRNTYLILAKGGIFRCVLPDLKEAIDQYIEDKKRVPEMASFNFMDSTLLGIKRRPKGTSAVIQSIFGNSHHLYMWDYESLGKELINAGFSSIRECTFNDSAEPAFKEVEDEGRFYKALAIEALK